jgi:hypothetical protein
MTLGGWLLLVLSWSAIVGLTTFCFVRMIKGGKL